MPRRPNSAAVGSARELIESLQIRAPHEIDVELIANHLGLLMRRRPLEHEEGRLVRAGKHGIITVAESAFRSSKWRFVVAHELGHFLRHPKADSFSACATGDLSVYNSSGREIEANDFAVELLMPEALFKERCDLNRPSLREVGELATEFCTSLTSTALRFLFFSPEPCAVVSSREGCVEWFDCTSNFRFRILKGTKVAERTCAGELFAGKSVTDCLHQVDGDAWGDSALDEGMELFEHSKMIISSSVLTFLWHPH